jgi:hypothetical protein
VAVRSLIDLIWLMRDSDDRDYPTGGNRFTVLE